jgi:hypothetical protein
MVTTSVAVYPYPFRLNLRHSREMPLYYLYELLKFLFACGLAEEQSKEVFSPSGRA